MHNSFKRFLAWALVCILAVSAAPLARASDDALTRAEARDLILASADDYGDAEAADVLQGGREDEAATRAEVLVMLSRAFGELSTPTGDSARWAVDSTGFEDVPNWAKTQLSSVLAAGIVTPSGEGGLSPLAAVSRQELETLIHRIYALEGSNLKDDFYAFVNKEWLAASVIPDGAPMTSSIAEITTATNKQVDALIEEIVESTPEAGSAEEKIKNLYENILDWDARNEAGIAPIQGYLDAVEDAESLDELMELQNRIISETTQATLVGFSSTQKLENSTQRILAFLTFSATLTKELYAMQGVEEFFLSYVTTLFQLSGMEAAGAAEKAAAYVAMDKALAEAQMSSEEQADLSKAYNIVSAEDLKAMFPNVDLDKVLAAFGYHAEENYVVLDMGLLEKCASYFNDEHLEDLKCMMTLNLLNSFGPLLNRAFYDAAQTFNAALLGIEGSTSDKEQAAAAVRQYLPDYLGQAYVEKYFSAEAKADVENMIDEILAVYKDRIQDLTWMGGETKAKAIEKLDAITVNVGYPDQWNDLYDNVDIRSAANGGSYYENVVAMCKAVIAEAVAEQDEPVDKTVWGMSVYEVNAYYDCTANSINFPAGILQAPLYDVEADSTENLGGIGHIVAHEISHAFDSTGAQFDKEGNQSNWWTEEDLTAFEDLCQNVVAFFDGVEAAPGITCNGTLTLAENIADLGALACVTQIESQEEEPDYQTLYRALARTWRSTASRETRSYLSLMDTHAPDKLRANRALQSLDEFYTAFDIQEGDGMYLPEDARVQIW